MNSYRFLFGTSLLLCFLSGVLPAQPARDVSLKDAVALALEKSPDVARADAERAVAERNVGSLRSQFLPNLFTGTGAAYTNGFPQAVGGAAPSIFNLSYIQTLFNAPLRGQLKAAEERAQAARLGVDQARNRVILDLTTSYLELNNVRHSTEILRSQRESASRIAGYTRERGEQGLELGMEVTRADLAVAKIEQRLAQLAGRDEVLDEELRRLTGLSGSSLRLTSDAPEMPPAAATPELVTQALAASLELQQAEQERKARERRVQGERGASWPTVDLVGEYSILTRFNNYDEFFRRFQRHNVNVGVQVRIPIYSSGASSSLKLAQSELALAQSDIEGKRSRIETTVRRQAGRVRELEAAREVARLELRLAEENVKLLQARFEEGRISLRELESARLEQNERWLGFLDAEYQKQHAQLELMESTGRLSVLLQ